MAAIALMPWPPSGRDLTAQRSDVAKSTNGVYKFVAEAKGGQGKLSFPGGIHASVF